MCQRQSEARARYDNLPGAVWMVRERLRGCDLVQVGMRPVGNERAAQRLRQSLQRLTGRSGAEGPPWEWLENHPRVPAGDLRQLRSWYADAYSERRIPLVRLHNLIVRTERQLAA